MLHRILAKDTQLTVLTKSFCNIFCVSVRNVSFDKNYFKVNSKHYTLEFAKMDVWDLHLLYNAIGVS